MKGILMNPWEVRAILDNRKTLTRRVVKGYALDHLELDTDGSIIGVYNQDEGHVFPVMDYAPYRPGDILYVRETWARIDGDFDPIWFEEPALLRNRQIIYRAEHPEFSECRWRPSIHMPREAARIFLRVTDVRVERLQDITEEQAVKEGFEAIPCDHPCGYPCTDCMNTGYLEPAMLGFVETWNSTIKPADRALYSWNANPWVWAIEFERISREEAQP